MQVFYYCVVLKCLILKDPAFGREIGKPYPDPTIPRKAGLQGNDHCSGSGLSTAIIITVLKDVVHLRLSRSDTLPDPAFRTVRMVVSASFCFWDACCLPSSHPDHWDEAG